MQTYNINQDAANNPNGFSILETYLYETLSRGILIPGVTVDRIVFTKQGQAFVNELTGEAQTTALCDATTTDNKLAVIPYEIAIDQKASFPFTGCFLSNLTDLFFDNALYDLSQDAILVQLEQALLNLLDNNNTPVTGQVALTASNILPEINKAKEEYNRALNKAPTVIIADYSISTLIKNNALVSTNERVAGMLDNVDKYDGMIIIYTDLTAYGTKFFMYRYERVKMAFVNPNEASRIPELDEVVVDGAIIRKTEDANHINRTSTMHIPFGVAVFNPLYVRSYSK